MDGSSPFGERAFKKEWVGTMENEDTKISVTLGYTLNLGNFQSLRVDLGIVDSKKNGETTDDAFNRVYKFVEDKLTEKVQEAQAEAAEQ
jgi:hypothetical protein